jgi:flagellar hook-length control protein FliK
MNRVNHADKAAQAAKADFTAPVAANRGQQERAGNTAATAARQPAHRNAAAANAHTSQAAPAKSHAGPAPAKNAQSGAGAQTAKATQSGKTAPAAEHADEASAGTPVVAPFAHMLHPVDLPAAGTEDNAAAAPVAEAADGANTAAGTDALPAMITSMLNAGAAPGGTLALAADARGETVSAVSTLSNSATRLNLAAASVAVNVVAPLPAADAAAARGGAQLQAATAATAQVVSTPAGAAVQGAVAPHAKADAPAADGTVPGPVPATDAAAPQTANAAAPAPRALPRGAEAAAGQPANTGAAPPATATVAKDENRATAAVPAATTASAGLTAGAPAAPAASGATVKLAGTPEQWQQPLRQALGDRLQLNLQRNNDHAVIRLEPPNMGSIEISIRHSAGALQVNLSANNSEVLRQLNAIGDSVRQDLSTRQFSDVAVTVSSSRAQSQAQADSGGRNGQQREQDDARTPGRALSEDGAASLFAMTSEQE